MKKIYGLLLIGIITLFASQLFPYGDYWRILLSGFTIGLCFSSMVWLLVYKI